MGTFKDLEVFQSAVQYVKSIYQTTQNFPKEEQFGLTNQIRKSAVSIASSIAEGSGRKTALDRKHFIDIAAGSLHESHAQLIIAKELGYIDDTKLSQAEEFISKLRAKLFAFYKSIQDRTPSF